MNRRFLSDEAGVSAKTRALLASGEFGQIVGFDRDTVIIEEGQPVDSLFFTLSGLFHASSTANPNATNRLLGKIQAAEFIGEVSIIEDSGNASATVTARENSRALRVSRDAFEKFCGEHPAEALEFLRAVAKQLCKRLRNANEKLL